MNLLHIVFQRQVYTSRRVSIATTSRHRVIKSPRNLLSDHPIYYGENELGAAANLKPEDPPVKISQSLAMRLEASSDYHIDLFV